MGYSIWAKVFFLWGMLCAELTKEIGGKPLFWSLTDDNLAKMVYSLCWLSYFLLIWFSVGVLRENNSRAYFGCMKKRRRRVDLKSCMTLASYLAWVVLQIQNNTIKLAEQPMWTQNYFVLCKKWVPLTHFERLFLFLNDSEPLFVNRKNRIQFGVAAKFYFYTWMTQNILQFLAPTEKVWSRPYWLALTLFYF